MGYKWYVYAPLEPRNAARRIEEAQRALAQALVDAYVSPDAILKLGIPAIELNPSPPPTPFEARERQEPGEILSSEVLARLSRCTLSLRIDRPPDDPLAMTGVRHLLRGLSGAVVTRGFSYETAEDVLAELSTEREEEPEVASAGDLVRQTLAHVPHLEAMIGTDRHPDVAEALQLVQSLQSAQRNETELTRVGPALARLSTLAQRYVRDLLQYGPFADVDAAEMYEVSAARVVEIRAEVRRALAR